MEKFAAEYSTSIQDEPKHHGNSIEMCIIYECFPAPQLFAVREVQLLALQVGVVDVHSILRLFLSVWKWTGQDSSYMLDPVNFVTPL